MTTVEHDPTRIAASLAVAAIMAVACGDSSTPAGNIGLASNAPSMKCEGASTTGSSQSPHAAIGAPVESAPRGKLAFVNIKDGLRSIYTADANGGGAILITQGPQDGDPAWSPDGRLIAFTRQCSFVQVYIIGADGIGLTQLTANGANTNPNWAPDGQRLAFVSSDDLPAKIFIMNRDGSAKTRLTAVFNERTWDGSPAWSPDGSMIAFIRDRASKGARLFVIKPDGTGEREIDTATVPTHPSWSPDSKTIAYSGLTGSHQQIWLINADGTGEKLVTTSPSDHTTPAWTGDGKHLVFSSDSSNTQQIYVSDFAGGGQILVSFVSGQNWFPSWCCIR